MNDPDMVPVYEAGGLAGYHRLDQRKQRDTGSKDPSQQASRSLFVIAVAMETS